MNVTEWAFLFILALMGGIGLAARSWRTKPTRIEQRATSHRGADTFDSAAVYRALDPLLPPYERSAQPGDLPGVAEFEAVVEMLCARSVPATQVLTYLTGDNGPLACAAGEALRRRRHDPDLTDEVIARLGRVAPWVDWFSLQCLVSKASRPVVGEVFVKSNELWAHYPAMRDHYNTFMEGRRKAGEEPSFGELLEHCSEERLEALQSYLPSLRPDLAQPLLDDIAAWRQQRVDTKYLESVGRVWAEVEQTQDLVIHHELEAALEALEDALARSPPRSVVVTGEPGVGKSVLIRELGRRVQARGWRVFESTATNLMAGQIYIGELEGRIKKLVDNLGAGRRVLWYVPKFHELYFAGRHRFSEIGILDHLLPYIENDTLTIVGESPLDAFDRLLRVRPQLRAAVDVVRLESLDDSGSLDVALEWAARRKTPGDEPYFSPSLIKECHRLARYHLGERGAPGNTFRLMRTALERHEAGDAATPVQMDDVLRTLSRLTGLPMDVLDDRQRLDLESIRSAFSQRVLGQSEAVECLVERIAMLKAGLTDPDRPLGVFLFAGPTGTGKTEIAKTLATFLFGSPERMTRLDMSEFSTNDAVNRLIHSDTHGPEVRTLASRVQQQPFSVVLLDEFEKAHPSVWDLFLQVFDDGRLTDAQGNSADFRHTIIVLTSNLGATVGEGSSIGFTPDKAWFSPSAVKKAIERTFRRELVNRIDRVVIFRPLNRKLMREILYKELEDALGRRGLRHREWAVEWEESAIEFLLDKGFTADLGARPLKRAIEQHVLAPLAMTIVEHKFPEGDQFLFLRSDGDGVQVEFVDPDAPEPDTDQIQVPEPRPSASTTLRGIAAGSRGSAEEVRLLRDCYRTLKGRLETEPWHARKEKGLASTNSTSFWESPERHRVLGEIELMDRVESGMQTAGSLLARIEGNGASRTTYSPNLLGRLAQQLYLVGMACDAFDRDEPQDAYVLIEGSKVTKIRDDEAARLFRAIVDMYQRWAKKRRMRHSLLTRTDGGSRRAILAVSGFGAHAILSTEGGLHVWEIPGTGRDPVRYQVRVRVAPQPDESPREHLSPLERAERAFAGLGEEKLQVARRYRELPSPLVRDSARGWRTGRLDRVLDGDFDLMT